MNNKAACHGQLRSPQHEMIHKYISITRMHRSIIDRRLSATGVYRSQHQILMYVADNPFVSQIELARMYGVSGATVAVSLKKLEKGGYIVREADEKDGRLNHISITDKGRKVVADSVKIFRNTELCMFRGFTEQDMKQMGEFLDRIYENLKGNLTSEKESEEI